MALEAQTFPSAPSMSAVSTVDSAAPPAAPATSAAADGAFSRMPSDTAFTQQRIRSWQPLLDPKWVIAVYIIIGIVFIPVGECTY
jgi:hypothetical protein